jgi:hypothetical protein
MNIHRASPAEAKERNARIQADRDAGMSVVELSKKYELSVSTIGVYTKNPNPIARTAKPLAESGCDAVECSKRCSFQRTKLNPPPKKPGTHC